MKQLDHQSNTPCPEYKVRPSFRRKADDRGNVSLKSVDCTNMRLTVKLTINRFKC